MEENKKTNDYVMKLPESEKPKEEVSEPNLPARGIMRVVGGIIDVCIIFLALLGFRQVFMNTGMGTAYRHHMREAIKISDSYKLEKLVSGKDDTFGYKKYEDEEGYQDFIKDGYLEYEDSEVGKSYVVANYENIAKDVQDAFKKAVNGDTQFKNYTFNARLIEFGIVTLSITCSETIFLLAIPLMNKKRATIGKIAAGTQVINSKYETEARWYQMVGRFFWILAFESFVPIFFLSSVIWAPVASGTLMLVISLTNKQRRTIHDFVSRTRVIDSRSFVTLMDQ